MSFRGLRQSKFRHVFGQPLKKDQCYDNIRITKSSWDSTFCSANPKYVAIITEAAGGGAFLVLPLERTGRLDPDTPKVCGHRAAVLDIQWCPHNDDVIASGSEDCTVKVWKIPEGGLYKNLNDPVVDLIAHQRRVGLLSWHPSALNILLSAGSDNKVFVWNCGTGEALVEIDFPDLPWSVAWNFDGSKIITTCKDKMLRICDPRTGELLAEGKGHEGSKPQQVVFLRDGRVFSTGFSRMSERQYALWKPDLTKLTMQEIDSSNGVIFPFYDSDSNMIYLCGKGDCAIKYFEILDESPYIYFLNQYQSTDPQRGIGMMPKRGVNVNQCEITRFYKLHQKGLCEVIPMIVPRKSELFQDDLYPDAMAEEAAISAEDWFSGKNADPMRVSMRDHFTGIETPGMGKTVKKSNILDKKPVARRPASTHENSTPSTPAKPATPVQTPVAAPTPTPAPASAPAPAPTPVRSEPPVAHTSSAVSTNASTPAPAEPSEATLGGVKLPPGIDFQNIMDDIRKLKIIVKGHERRIKALEETVARHEQNDSHI